MFAHRNDHLKSNFNAKSDKNIHQNAPNCTFSPKHFLVGRMITNHRRICATITLIFPIIM